MLGVMYVRCVSGCLPLPLDCLVPGDAELADGEDHVGGTEVAP